MSEEQHGEAHVPEASSQKQSLLARMKQVSWDAVTQNVVLYGVVLLPLFFIPGVGFSLEISKTLFLTAFVLVAFLAWLLARLQSGSVAIPSNPIFASALAVVIVFLVSAFFSPSVPGSLHGFAYETGTVVSVGALFLLCILTALSFSTNGHALRAYKMLLAVLGVVVLFQAIRFALGADFLSLGIFTSNVDTLAGKWNDLAVFAGWAALLSLITLEMFTEKRSVRASAYAILALSLLTLAIVNFFLIWAIVGTFALVIFVYDLAFLRFMGARENLGKKASFSPVAFAVLAVSFAFLVAGSSLGGFFSQKLNIVHLEVRPSWSATGAVLKESIKESPLLGAGPNRFVNEWLLHKPEGINASLFWNTDFRSGVGTLPTFGVMTGVLGIVALGLFLILLAYQGVRYLFGAPDKHTHFVLFSSFALAAYLWIASLFYVPGTALLALAFFMTGIFVSVANRQGKFKTYALSFFENPKVGFVSVLVLLVFVVGTVAMGYFTFQKFLSLKNFQAGRVAFNSGDFGAADARITRSIRQSASDTNYRGLAELKTHELAALVRSETTPTESARARFQELLGSGINAGQLAVQYDRTNYTNWLALSRVYAGVTPFVRGAYENADASLSQAVALNPKSPMLALERARLEILNGNRARAKDLIASALSMKPDYADAIFLLAQLAVAEGRTAEAVQSLEQAAFVSPNDEGIFFQLGLLRYNEEAYEAAAAALERAVALNPQFSNARYFLGLSYYFLDRDEEAIAQFKELEALNPGNAGVTRIRENMEQGRSPFADSKAPAPLEEGSAPPIEE